MKIIILAFFQYTICTVEHGVLLASGGATSKLSVMAFLRAQKSRCQDHDTAIIIINSINQIGHTSVNQNTGGVTLIILIHWPETLSQSEFNMASTGHENRAVGSLQSIPYL
jgi:hypothetical protein